MRMMMRTPWSVPYSSSLRPSFLMALPPIHSIPSDTAHLYFISPNHQNINNFHFVFSKWSYYCPFILYISKWSKYQQFSLLIFKMFKLPPIYTLYLQMIKISTIFTSYFQNGQIIAYLYFKSPNNQNINNFYVTLYF